MTLEELTEVFLRVRPHLTREDARLWAQRLQNLLQELPHGWKIALEDLAVTYLDDVERYPGLTEEQALEMAEATRSEFHRRRHWRKTKQQQFEDRCIPVDFTALRWEESNHED